MQRLLLIPAVILGLGIAYCDTRPNWDDTGVTVFALLAVSGVFGAWAPRRPWLWAFAVGIWTPILNLMLLGNWGSVVALVVTLVGAYAGMGLRTVFSSSPEGTFRSSKGNP